MPSFARYRDPAGMLASIFRGRSFPAGTPSCTFRSRTGTLAPSCRTVGAGSMIERFTVGPWQAGTSGWVLVRQPASHRTVVLFASLLIVVPVSAGQSVALRVPPGLEIHRAA